MSRPTKGFKRPGLLRSPIISVHDPHPALHPVLGRGHCVVLEEVGLERSRAIAQLFATDAGQAHHFGHLRRRAEQAAHAIVHLRNSPEEIRENIQHRVRSRHEPKPPRLVFPYPSRTEPDEKGVERPVEWRAFDEPVYSVAAVRPVSMSDYFKEGPPDLRARMVIHWWALAEFLDRIEWSRGRPPYFGWDHRLQYRRTVVARANGAYEEDLPEVEEEADDGGDE